MRRAVLCLFVLALAVPGAVAQEEMMTPEQTAAWQQAMTPGEHHAHLAVLEGTWTTSMKMWPAADAPPIVSEGTAVFTPLLGGRYYKQVYTSSFMGMPFEGLGMIGYDKVAGEYVSTWADNMSTGLLVEKGTCDGEGKVFKSKGDYVDPMTGEKSYMRSVHTIKSKDENVLEMYGPGPDGKEFKMMEIVYTRR